MDSICMSICHIADVWIFRKFLFFPDQTITNASSRQHIFKRVAKSRIDVYEILHFRKTITERRYSRVIKTIVIWAIIYEHTFQGPTQAQQHAFNILQFMLLSQFFAISK